APSPRAPAPGGAGSGRDESEGQAEGHLDRRAARRCWRDPRARTRGRGEAGEMRTAPPTDGWGTGDAEADRPAGPEGPPGSRRRAPPCPARALRPPSSSFLLACCVLRAGWEKGVPRAACRVPRPMVGEAASRLAERPARHTAPGTLLSLCCTSRGVGPPRF